MHIPNTFSKTCVSLFVSQLLLGQAHAATFNVSNTNDTGDGSLRNAISLTNADAIADEINFTLATPATITLSSGEILVTEDVTINGIGEENLTIQGSGSDRLFHLDSANVTLNSMTLTGGSLTLSTSGYANNGGALFVSSSDLEINECTISENTASIGGAISARFSTVTMNNSDILNNFAQNPGYQARGGAISSAFGLLTINNSELSDNYSEGMGGAVYSARETVNIDTVTLNRNTSGTIGAAIQSRSTYLTINRGYLSNNSGGNTIEVSSVGVNPGEVDIVNSTIDNNEAAGIVIFNASATIKNSVFEANQYAGLIASISTVEIEDSLFSANTSPSEGGGISIGSNSTATITNSTIEGNSAMRTGGGIAASSGTAQVDISNSTISGNSAMLSGGGISMLSSSISIDHSIIAFNNSANRGGGIYAFNGSLGFTNSVVTGNAGASGEDGYLRNGTNFTSLGTNLFGDDAKTLAEALQGFAPANTDIDATSDSPDSASINSILDSSRLSDNGGPVATHALAENSIAVDAGDNANCAALDQRGIVRPASVEDPCDIGPFEQTDADRAKFGSFFVLPLPSGEVVIFSL